MEVKTCEYCIKEPIKDGMCELCFSDKKKKEVKICKTCGSSYTRRGLYCGSCLYKYYGSKEKYGSKYQKYMRMRRSLKRSEEFITQDKCIEWIDKCVEDKFMTDIYGLLYLILVYDSMGGSSKNVDEMKPGDQLDYMWKYCYNKYKKIKEICQ